ncbi:MAG: single-stranded DNA-binding protein [Chloroflexales bacterium]
MTANVNRTHLTGNLGSDPESRFSATGTLIVTASIAVHSSYKQGEAWKERTDWFRLVAFGEAGEALGRFGKGERIQVTGRLQSSEYTDREGQRRTSVEVVVLRSAPAPLPRKAAAEAEAEPEAEPEVEVEAEAEPAAEASQPKPRRRRKVAA